MKIQEQEIIVETKNKNLIVSASAGSGKTTVMIRKILKYILDGDCHVDELLVLTYTNASGQEMKKKLIDKLKENLNEYPFLQEELELVQTSDISTIDSFCQKIVKKYFYVLNIDPSFNILQGGEKDFYQEEALSKSIKELKLTNPSAYENLLENLSAKRDERHIKKYVINIYDYVTSILDYDSFFKKSLELYDNKKLIAENFLLNYYLESLQELKDRAEKLKQNCMDLNFLGYVNYLNNLLIYLDNITLRKSISELVENLPTFNSRLYEDKTDEIGRKNEISLLKKEIDKIMSNIKENYVSANSIKSSYNNCFVLIQNIINLTNIFIEKYKEVKDDNNYFDFNDIERLAIKILENDEIRKEVSLSYKYIFVDEYQDANSVQEKIIYLLENNNLFFVGDVKQSIYGFRQSEPQIFLNTIDNFSKEEKSEALYLNCNFRSNKNILEFANYVFNVLMTNSTCGINYKKDSQFDPKANYEDLNNETCVEVNILANEIQEKEDLIPQKVYSVKDNSNTFETQTKNDKQCLFICNKIANLLGTEIFDKDQNKTRPISFKDIVILVAKRGDFVNCLIKHFSNVGIPFVVNVNDNLEECYDNMVLFSLIKYALNRFDDYSLYTILSSNLFNFSDSELATIKLCGVDKEYFYECFESTENILDENLLNKIEQFNKTINEFYFDLKYKGIYYALDKIVIKTNYLINISYEEDYNQRKTNVINYIDSFINSNFNFNANDYLLYREKSVRQDKIQTDKNFIEAVEITTMHSSKGLEYPVVILPNLDQDFTKEVNKSEICINKELGIGIKHFNSELRVLNNGIFYDACKKKNRLEENSERIRLLYVAITRAKNKLILIANKAKEYKKIIRDSQVLKLNNFMSAIVGCFDENVIENINASNDYQTILYNNEKIKLNVVTPVAQEMISSTNVCLEELNNLKTKSISKFLEFDISKQVKNIPLKNSVSEFAFDENSSLNFSPNNLTYAEHLTEKASDVGTLYHSLLERINFSQIGMIDDLEYFISTNFSEEDVKILKKIGFNNIYENIKLLNEKTKDCKHILKEQKFVMYVPYSLVTSEDISDKILIQGIIDLVVIKENEILLIDYKLSKKSNIALKEKYKKQLFLYEMALKNKYRNLDIKKYILNLNGKEFIEINN